MTREEVIKELKVEYLGDSYTLRQAKDIAIETLKSQKTGHWIEMGQNKDKTHNVICSECKVGFKFRGHANSIHTQMKYRFCSYCGADMRGE